MSGPREVRIAGRPVGPGRPTFIVAELSANHRGSFEDAVRLIHAAREAGADAVKLQTYTAGTMTLESSAPPFVIGEGTLWAGRSLFELYTEASTPWEWHGELKRTAESLGLVLFSSPFDATAVEFLAGLDVPAYKIASFELVDIPLIRRAAVRGKPMILSTGMASVAEIEEAVAASRAAGGEEIVLLKCTSAYPAPVAAMNLLTIPDMAARFAVPVGLSDHSLGATAAIAAVALGACLVEKHLTLSRQASGPDSPFSLEPDEFAAMVRAVRETEAALGTAVYAPGTEERASLQFRRSLFVVAPVRAGEVFTEHSVRAIRPGSGLPPKHLPAVLGRRASRDVAAGTPLSWDLVE